MDILKTMKYVIDGIVLLMVLYAISTQFKVLLSLKDRNFHTKYEDFLDEQFSPIFLSLYLCKLHIYSINVQ